MSSSIKANSIGAPVAGSSGLARAIILVLILGAVVGIAYWASIPRGNLISSSFSEPLNQAKAAKIDVDADRGHLTIDRLVGGEGVLADGKLQHFESRGLPARSLSSSDGRAVLSIKGGGTAESWLQLPWAACGGAYEWQIHLNPAVPADLTAVSGGGNLKLDLAGMAITRLFADTAGGNVDVVLPDNAANLTATAKSGGGNVVVTVGDGIAGSNTISASSGGGNVTVRLPSGVAARVHATSGLGTVTVDPKLGKTDKDTYQSSGFESAANRVEITVSSGAGDVSVSYK